MDTIEGGSVVQTLGIIRKDPWLKGYEGELLSRYRLYRELLGEIEAGGRSVSDFANGFRYYGFNYSLEERGWWFREWLPAAKDVYLFGDFNHWNKTELRLEKSGEDWAIFLPDDKYGEGLIHGSFIKLLVHGADDGWAERIPSYIRRVVQNETTKNWNGQLWAPPVPFDWGDDNFDTSGISPLLIYESHVGMSQEREGVGTYAEFTENVLPRIKEQGYNAVQLMAVAEHPYYGSFGYHVSNFYAVSSRSGTPEELKELVRTAHGMGIAVIMDIVHSHYVKNTNEGLNRLDGSDYLYSRPGSEGDHPHWDSKLFDYAKGQVRHFLLSNIKFWLEEFHFDGFRFDGVTSMIYYHHGYTEFDDPGKYFDGSVNHDALAYLTLANKLIHSLKPDAISVAEDVSGMPGMCIAEEDGGVGFDYRLGMAIPDFWIKLLKDISDEEWDIWEMWRVMTDRLPDVKTIAYCESHDQALVGDKTLAFRLIDSEMYTNMDRTSKSVVVDRGIALHKMIRLFTIALGGEAYLNFMGNEFGHPEWIDFPREGNGWSYAYARRQWSLAGDGFLRYALLNRFDREMIALVKKYDVLGSGYAWNLQMDEQNKTIVFNHGDTVFLFNWHPSNSIPDYIVHIPFPGTYEIVLTTDSASFGGPARIDEKGKFFSFPNDDGKGNTNHYMQVYNVNRCATVFRRKR